MPTKEEIDSVINTAYGFTLVVTVGDEEAYDEIFFNAGDFDPEVMKAIRKELLRLNEEGKAEW